MGDAKAAIERERRASPRREAGAEPAISRRVFAGAALATILGCARGSLLASSSRRSLRNPIGEQPKWALNPAWMALQLRLGLRRAEVCAISEDWIDEAAGMVHVRVSDGFDTKSHESRAIDGVDTQTLALAREVLTLKASCRLSVSGYTEAWKRACRRLAERGTPWCYWSKTHGLRAAYATQSRLAGVPLSVVRDRMGHASGATTERHYIERTSEPVASPFAAVARFSCSVPKRAAGGGAKILPFPVVEPTSGACARYIA